MGGMNKEAKGDRNAVSPKGKSKKTNLKFDHSEKDSAKSRKLNHGDVTRIYLSEIGLPFIGYEVYLFVKTFMAPTFE